MDIYFEKMVQKIDGATAVGVFFIVLILLIILTSVSGVTNPIGNGSVAFLIAAGWYLASISGALDKKP